VRGFSRDVADARKKKAEITEVSLLKLREEEEQYYVSSKILVCLRQK